MTRRLFAAALCTFEVGTHVGRRQRVGVYVDGRIVDVNFAAAWHQQQKDEPEPQRLADALAPGNMLDFLRAGPRALHAAEHAAQLATSGWETACPMGVNGETLIYREAEVRLLAPLPNPNSVRDFYAFEAHVKKGFEKRGEPMPPEWYQIPVYYKSGHNNIIGTGEDVRWPSFTAKFDYELELAAVIGKRGANIKAADAARYIAGFTVMNDFSGRLSPRSFMFRPRGEGYWTEILLGIVKHERRASFRPPRGYGLTAFPSLTLTIITYLQSSGGLRFLS